MSELLGQYRVVALDTCVWIYHMEGHPDYYSLMTKILTAVSARYDLRTPDAVFPRCRANTSDVCHKISAPLDVLVRALSALGVPNNEQEKQHGWSCHRHGRQQRHRRGRR